MKHEDHPVLGKFNENVIAISKSIDARQEELRACYQRIEELQKSLAEMVGIYWGEGDGHEPPPACIIRATELLEPAVQS